MQEVSLLRLGLLRTGYLLLVVGLGLTIWPEILDPAAQWAPMRGVVVCMLGALCALSVLGLRNPLQMLPVLFFEMTWKALWLLRVALPAWQAGRMDAAMGELVFACSIAVVFPLVIPWGYVWREYVARKGDPWWRRDVSRVAVGSA